MSARRTIQRSWKKTRFNDYYVIDGDRHVIEPITAFTEYLEPSFRDRGAVIDPRQRLRLDALPGRGPPLSKGVGAGARAS